MFRRRFIWNHCKTSTKVDCPIFFPSKQNRVPDTYKEFKKAVMDICKVRKCFEKPKEMKPLPDGVDPGSIPTHDSFGISSKLS